MIGHNKQQPLVDSSTQQRIRPPLPTPNQIQFNQTGSLYIPDGHLNINQINEYNTIRTNNKNSLDRQLFSSGMIENTYHEPQLLVGPQHSNNNNIYNSTNSGNSGGSTTNNTFNSMSNASNVAFAGPNSNAFSTFARLGSNVAPYGNNALCSGTNQLPNFTTAFSGTNNLHLSMAGSSGIGLSSSSKNPLCRFAGSTQHACLKFFCGQSVANGLWKASTFVLLIICILLTTFLLMGNQLNSDNQLPCPSSSSLSGVEDLKNELNKFNKNQLTSNVISNRNLLPSVANKRNKLSSTDQIYPSSLNKLNSKHYQPVNSNQAETYERISLDRTYYKLLHPFSHWNYQLDRQNLGSLLRFNYTFDKFTSRRQNLSLLVYAARNRLPSQSRYDFVEYIETAAASSSLTNELNGRDESNTIFNSLYSNTSSALLSSNLDSVRTRLSSADQLETREFLQYLDSGVWFISVINEQNFPVEIAFQVKVSGETCPVLCSNNGKYVGGRCECKNGFKGKECELSASECEVSDCNGHGYCMDSKCYCYPGYKGEHCNEIDCLDPFCSGHGQCVNGMCICGFGWRSADCSEKITDLCAQTTCSGHGQLDQFGNCICEPNWTGSDCSSQRCSIDCGPNGSCENMICICKPGFAGTRCQDKQCSSHCNLHGQCLNNGTCLCQKGWNGKHCILDGCANNCNGQGECVKHNDLWQCECSSSASGEFCEIPIETDCSDKIDNDNDGLIDCADSECCSNPACQTASESFCLNSPDPLEILLRKQPPALTATFFQRMQFLIEENSVQSYAQKNAFNESQASVIRGQVVDHNGNGLIGVRVGLANQQPTVGFVITRRNGHFDLMVNGGGTVILHLLRDPFKPTTQSVNVPWNTIVVLDPLQMQLQSSNYYKKNLNSTKPSSAGRSKLLYFNSPTQTLSTGIKSQTSICLDHDYERMRFIVLNEKCYSSVCVDNFVNSNGAGNANFKSTGNLNLKAYKNLLGLQGSDQPALSVQNGLTTSSSLESNYERLSLVEESVKIPGTDLNLIYSSNHADGYLMLVRLQLTPNKVSPNLLFVHVNIKIEGNLIEKKLEAEPNLIYNYGWDKRNVYRQKVYGLTNALVNVGYEYINCDQIIWETKRVQIRANDLPITEVGGLFNLDIHHRYNLQHGILHKGNGENLYLNQLNPMMISTILGDGTQRPLHCTYCNGDLNLSHVLGEQNNNYQNEEAHKRLLEPVALATSNDGSIFVGDFNLIRKINLKTGKITTIIELNSSQVAYKYHLTVSPADNRLYFSDPEKYQIFAARSTSLDEQTGEEEPDPKNNLELIAGKGIKCLPGDKNHCGDRKPAREAKLSYPKALAVNLMNEIFIADGTNIRYIDQLGIIYTLIGDHHNNKAHWRPFPCNTNAQPLMKTNLRWPTELAINPIDNQLYILDDHMVFKVTNDRRLQIVAGKPAHCAGAKHQNDLDSQFDNTLINSRGDQFNLTSFTSDSNNQANTWMPANSVYLETPQAIAFTNQGNLLIAESDSQTVNRVRIVLNYRNHQLIGDYVGNHQSSCNCMEMNCYCFDRELNIASNAKLSTISAITVTANGDLIIADQGNLRIRRVNQNNLPQPVNINGDYEILSASTNEIYVFNKYGQHMQTKSSLNKNVIYSFAYNVNNSFGKLSSVTETENTKKLNFLRDPHNQVKMIESNNLKINLAFNKLRLLSEVNLNNGNTIKFDYYRTGLLKSRVDKLSNNMEHSVIFDFDDYGRLINKKEN